MKVAVLHGSNQGFFPRFYKDLKSAVEFGSENEVRLFAPNSGQNKRCVLPNQVVFGSRLNWHIHNFLFKLTGKQDCWSHLATWDLIQKLKAFSPDVIHLNVVNQCQINFRMLVRYINKNHIPVVWTFHDCRTFTGGCPYFDEVGCNEWKTGCKNCPDKGKQYVAPFAKTDWQWRFRKDCLDAIENLTIVTPSQWLTDFVKQSFFKDRNVKVIYNGVDTERFSKKSSFDVYEAYHIDRTKKIVLGCAINWEIRKGMVFFEEMACFLPKDYEIVLVGGIQETKKKELEEKGIICTGRTKTFEEMTAWYQSASVFANPTLADNFPTTNIEALASGCPVVTFQTGGSPEAVDENTGLVVEKGNVSALVKAIIEICENKEKRYSNEKCINRATHFSKRQYLEYVKLYKKLLDSNNVAYSF